MANTSNNRNTNQVYVSSDVGTTWQLTFEEDAALNSFDPACAYGQNHEVFFETMGFRGGDPRTETFLLRSADDGRTWKRITGLPRSVDRPYVTVDRSKRGRDRSVYLHGKRDLRTLDLEKQNAENLWIAKTVDDGQTFSQLDVPTLAKMVTAGNGAVLEDGTFVTVIGEASDRKDRSKNAVKAVRLARGAASIDVPTKIADWSLHDDPHLMLTFSLASHGQRLYAAWEDDRSGRIEVIFSSSGDGGVMWSQPIRLTSNDVTNGSGFNPSVAVNSAGVVGVLWYDTRDHRADLGWGVRFAASTDGGKTFTHSVRVSEKDAQPGPGLGRPGRFSGNGGDTSGLDVEADGAFRAAWIDNRTGIPQVWTTRVMVTSSSAVK